MLKTSDKIPTPPLPSAWVVHGALDCEMIGLCLLLFWHAVNELICTRV
jgi:hypothetical protein